MQLSVVLLIHILNFSNHILKLFCLRFFSSNFKINHVRPNIRKEGFRSFCLKRIYNLYRGTHMYTYMYTVTCTCTHK